ncbi:MAG: hydrogenase 4 subunit D [Anaerolineales bacterium]|jgi:hydrogenase-4 component D|nr:hydrogenase 4 subunit D [Anaerolineales bacterium]
MTGLIIASILAPFLGGLLVLVIPRAWIKLFSQAVALAAAACSLLLLISFASAGKTPATVNLISLGNTVVFGLVIDRLSVLIGLAFILVGFLIVVYSTGYLSDKNREHPEKEVERRYYFFLLCFIGSMAGVVYASTMLGMLIFFELTGVCSWGLIGYYDNEKARKAALKAIIVTQAASIGLYAATAYFFAVTRSLQLSEMAGLTESAKTVIFLGVLIAGFGKSAQLPFHFWLPDAMVAPTPISAYLHAASMVKVGVYIFARCLGSANGAPKIIGVIGCVCAIATMIYGFIMYFPQKDLKKLLAYSTIAQLSYIFFALSLSVFGSTLAFNGAVAHIFNHAFAKGLFFLVAGALSYTTGTRMLPSLRGVLAKMPLVGASFAVAALAVTGVPPFNCFFSKFTIFAGGFEAAKTEPLLLILVIIAMFESIGSFAWLFWIFSSTVPGEPSEEVASATALAPSMQAVLIALAGLTLVSGFFAANWIG